MQIFENYLDIGDDSVRTTWTDIWSARLFLNPDHPSTTERLLRAGVTRKRLETPLVEFYRHHYLVDAAGREEAFLSAGIFYEPKFEQFPPGPEDWFRQMIDGAVRGDFIDGKGVREEPTPMLINMGAHLTNMELGDNLTPMHHLEAMETIVSESLGAVVRRNSDGMVDLCVGCSISSGSPRTRYDKHLFRSLRFCEPWHQVIANVNEILSVSEETLVRS